MRLGIEVSQEEEARALAELDHPEFALLWDHADLLPDRFHVGEMTPSLHVQLHQVIETQLLGENPPEIRPAMAHLLELGCDRHTAIHLIMNGLLEDIHTALRERTPHSRNRWSLP